MTAAVSQAQAQSCAAAAMADTVSEIGGVGIAAIEAGRHEDTIRRWIQGSPGDWELRPVAAIGVAAIRRTGRFLLLTRMSELLAGKAELPNARRLIDDVTGTMPVLLAQAQAMAAAIADHRMERHEVRALLAVLPELRQHLERIEADANAFLQAQR
jgi:hypothetical protein